MGDDRFVKNGKFQRVYRRKGRKNYHPAGRPQPHPQPLPTSGEGGKVEKGKVVMRTPVIVDRSISQVAATKEGGWRGLFYVLAVIAIAIAIGGTVVGILFR